MAIIACLAVILIVAFATVRVVHLCLIVFVTVDTLEHLVVLRIDMAGGATLPLAAMLAGVNAEILAVVIERSRRPGIDRVARKAIVGEIQRHVIRIQWSLEIILMARVTILGRAGITIVHMALLARHHCMCALQRKCNLVVIERRRLPCARRVACLARMREVAGNVVGICRTLKIALMAREAIHRCAGV